LSRNAGKGLPLDLSHNSADLNKWDSLAAGNTKKLQDAKRELGEEALAVWIGQLNAKMTQQMRLLREGRR
jgi:hypothetical protein